MQHMPISENSHAGIKTPTVPCKFHARIKITQASNSSQEELADESWFVQMLLSLRLVLLPLVVLKQALQLQLVRQLRLISSCNPLQEGEAEAVVGGVAPAETATGLTTLGARTLRVSFDNKVKRAVPDKPALLVLPKAMRTGLLAGEAVGTGKPERATGGAQKMGQLPAAQSLAPKQGHLARPTGPARASPVAPFPATSKPRLLRRVQCLTGLLAQGTAHLQGLRRATPLHQGLPTPVWRAERTRSQPH